MLIKDIDSDHVVTLSPGDSADKAIALMEEHNVRHLPVVQQGAPVGMVSDRDLLAAVGWLSSQDRVSNHEGSAIVGPQRVDHIMSRPVHVASPCERIECACRMLLKEKISAAPLVNDGKVVGIVTETDLLRCYVTDGAVVPRSGWRFEKVPDHHVIACLIAQSE